MSAHQWVGPASGAHHCSICGEPFDDCPDGPCRGRLGGPVSAARIGFLIERVELGAGVPIDMSETWDALRELVTELVTLRNRVLRSELGE